MIINTDTLRTRNAGKYLAIYGTQEAPFSSNYEMLDREEALKMATALRKVARDIEREAETLEEMTNRFL